MKLIKKTVFQASFLYNLAFAPDFSLKKSYQKSIDLEGWKKSFPASLILQRGTYPKIDGRHRLSYLNKTNKLDLLIPTNIYLVE